MEPSKEQVDAFNNWIETVAGIPSEYNRMYGHHLTSFCAGAEWEKSKNRQLLEQRNELVEALEGIFKTVKENDVLLTRFL